MPSEPDTIARFAHRTIGDTWRHDDKLLDKLFPVEDIPNPNYQKAREMLFNEHPRFKRWKGISADPKPMTRIYTPLVYLLNKILLCYGLRRNKRCFFDTHVRRTDSKLIHPGIFLSGVGPEFVSTLAGVPRVIWSSCISVIEVVLDSGDLMVARDRLVMHMDSIFRAQENRRFAFGLVITQNMFIVYMFDHSGVVSSTPYNYHAHPDRFCAVISGLAAKEDRIGFDNTVVNEGDITKIRTYRAKDGEPEKETSYNLTKGLFHFPSLVGRGTTCWLTSREDDPQSKFVIKDAWIGPSDPPGRESEASLLQHAQLCGVTMGVVRIVHFEDVRRSTDASDLDTILRNRQAEADPLDLGIDRVHTRMVLSPYGKTLDYFASREELLFAFNDVIFAHRQLHQVAGILHRDISVRNILINSKGLEGDRGVLIDFDHSIRIGDSTPYSTKTKIGTRRYMSRNVINARGPHTYLDDLESFYYVLCWILCAYERPGRPKAEIPNSLSAWDREVAPEAKAVHGFEDFGFDISPWFGQSLRRLAVGLHGFFRTRFYSIGRPLSALDPAKDYDEFLGHINQAIVDLKTEVFEQSSKSTQNQPAPTSGSQREKAPIRKVPHRRQLEFDYDEEYAASRRRRQLIIKKARDRATALSSIARPHRTTANYGIDTRS